MCNVTFIKKVLVSCVQKTITGITLQTIFHSQHLNDLKDNGGLSIA